MRFIGCIICLGVILGSIGAVLLSMYVVQVTADDADTLDLDNQKLAQTTIIYDKNGDEYATLSGDNNRIWVNYQDMPANLRNAVIAIEDKDFWTEPGVNIKRTVAAALNEFTGNAIYGARQGASTIEQQLVKNLTGDDDQDSMRKVREIFRAIGLDNRYSKETILEAYMNTISLTGRIGGMQAAANEYFGKDVDALSLAECATLASITKNPTGYNPYTNPENLVIRRNHCIALMAQQGYITDAESKAAQTEPLTLVESKSASENSTVTSNNSYFTDALYEQLKTDIATLRGVDETEAASIIYSGGLRVYSTVDPTLQSAMEQIMLNEPDSSGNELFTALLHDEEVDTGIPYDQADTVQYNEEGVPLSASGSAIFNMDDDIPVYTDDTNTTFKTGQSEDTNADGVHTLVFYEKVRTQAAMATLDYDGNVRAVVGGLGQKKYDRTLNRATVAHQTGSTMKPIGSYCLALQYKAITYSTLVPDTPFYAASQHKVLNTDYCRSHGLSLDPWNAANQAREDVWRDWPSNYSGTYSNVGVPVFSALEQSLNTVAVWVGSYVGTDNIYNFVHDTLNCRSLVESDADYGPIILGSQSVGISTVELAGAYSIFYDGQFTTPHYYTEVYDYQNNVYIDNSTLVSTTQAISPETATIMNRMLWNVLNDSQGTARGMTPDTPAELDAVAKTGTTSEFQDYTFCGLTPYYVTAVWWGFDKPTNMYDLGGKNGKPTQYAWKQLMETVEADLPSKEFPFSDNVVQKQFDPSSGAIVSSGGKTGYFTEDNLPNADAYADTSAEDNAALAAAQAAQDAAAAAGAPAADGTVSDGTVAWN